MDQVSPPHNALTRNRCAIAPVSLAQYLWSHTCWNLWVLLCFSWPYLYFIYTIRSAFSTYACFAFGSISWVYDAGYNKKPQYKLNKNWSFGDCFWFSLIKTHRAKYFLEKWWFDRNSSPSVFLIHKLMASWAFYEFFVFVYVSTKSALHLLILRK